MSFQLPKTCGINVNLNNLRGELQVQTLAILNVNLGTPAGLQEIANTIDTKLTTLKDKVVAQLPEVPQEIKTLRGELNKLAAMTAGSVEALQQQAAIALDYAGIKDIRGFADINLADITASVFSVSGTFDPCSMTIPDFSLTDGKLKKSPDTPDKGGQTPSAFNTKIQDVTDNLSDAIKNNTQFISGMDINKATTALESNVSTAMSGLENTIRKLPTGEQISEMQSDLLARIKKDKLPLMKET